MTERLYYRDASLLEFDATVIEHVGDARYRILGDLTIKQRTRPISLDAAIDGRIADPFGGKERIGITASGQLNRMDFGLNWDGLAGAIPMAGHIVKLNLDAEIVARVAEAVTA